MSKTIKPGLYEKMSPEIYYSSSALGSSRLKAFAESPLHYLKYEDMKDTPSLAFGRAAHSYVLEGPEVFAKTYAVMPDGMIRRGKQYDAFLVANFGKVIIKPDEMETILGMREALLDSGARDLILCEGRIEVSIFWKQDGIQCKGRLDKLVEGENIDLMIDYKTCVSASERDCRKSMENYKYWLQEAHYGTGYTKVTRRDLEAVFIFQEKTPPYDVCLMRMSDNAALMAYERHGELIKKLASCIKNKDFPGRNRDKGIIDWNFWGGDLESKEK